MEEEEFSFELEEVDVPNVDTARDYLDYEQEYEQPATTPEDASPKVWDANYLPSNIGTVKDMMEAIRGPVVNDWDDEELLEKYQETMRGFEAGNTITTYRFFQGMVGAEHEQLAKIGEGIKLWDNMGSAFGEGATWADTRQAVGDYAGALILDPANLLGLGLGKLFTGAGTKVAATGARVAATKALKKGGEKAAETVFRKALTEAGKETVENIAKRTAATQAKKGLARLATSTALKDAGYAIAMDTAVAVGTEYVYQDVRTTTGVQEEMNLNHVAIAALGTMAIGGIAYGSNIFKGSSGWTPTVRSLNEEADAGAVLRSIVDVAQTDSWAEKVARGTELKDLDGEFWTDLVNNMLPAMEQEGYIWVRRNPDDKVSNWLADVIKSAEPEDARIFAKEWSEATGIALPSLDEKGLEFFADTFAYKMNQSARFMRSASEVSRRLGREATIGDMIQDAVDGGTDAVAGIPFTNISPEKLFKVGGGKVARAQNNIIRLIVSNLSTTRLNLVGYGASAAVNTVSDVSSALLYAPQAAVWRVLGQTDKADEALRLSKASFAAQWQRAKNLVDPNTTYDQFLAYQQMRPNQMRELTTVLQGGIEDPSQIAKYYGIDANATVTGAYIDKGVEMIQQLNFVQAQDVYTKSQEFLTQMDKKVRVAFNMPLAEALNRPDLRKLMADPRWAKAEAEAVYETQRAIYSATYRRMGGELGRGAAFIEDFRNIPFVGLTIPFGRFFNNVVATTMDASGLSLAAKFFGYNKNRTFTDLAARATVTWTFVSMMADKEEENIERGLGVYETENSKGEIVDNRYTYPLSLYKGLARMVAYHRQGETPPQNEWEELQRDLQVWKTINQVFRGEGEVPENVPQQIREYAIGQLTRDLDESINDTIALMDELLTGGPGDATFGEVMTELFTKPVVAAVSGATRFIEPLNVMKQVADGVDMKQLDPKDGTKWLNDGFRYIDQFGATTSDVEKFDTAGGKRVVQLDKYFGDRSSRLTNTERVMNLVGIDHWDINETTESIAANNVFAKYFHSFLEDRATKLMDTKKFREGDLETRKVMWEDMLKLARDHTKGFMALKAGDDARYKLIVDIWNAGYGRDNIARAMERIAPDMEMEDLSTSQLRVLESYLKNRKDFIRLK